MLHPQQQCHTGLEDATLHPQPCGRLHPGAGRRRWGAVPGEALLLIWRGLSVPMQSPQWLPLPQALVQPMGTLCCHPEGTLAKRIKRAGQPGLREMGLPSQGLGLGGLTQAWGWRTQRRCSLHPPPFPFTPSPSHSNIFPQWVLSHLVLSDPLIISPGSVLTWEVSFLETRKHCLTLLCLARCWARRGCWINGCRIGTTF